MKLSDWAKSQGISYRTAWEWFKRGTLPVPARRLSTGTILVEVAKTPPGGVALYARVSSHDQKEDLDRQWGRLAQWAATEHLTVIRTAKEIGSGLNGHRSKLLALLGDPGISGMVVEHEDRLARFGGEYLAAALAASGRKLWVIDPGEMRDDLVQDRVDVLTSFCARLYGRRSARNRAQRALEAASQNRA
jgi:putative resolvase